MLTRQTLRILFVLLVALSLSHVSAFGSLLVGRSTCTLLHSAAAPVQADAPVSDTTTAEEPIETDNAFDVVASHAAFCLLQSDVRRDGVSREIQSKETT